MATVNELVARLRPPTDKILEFKQLLQAQVAPKDAAQMVGLELADPVQKKKGPVKRAELEKYIELIEDGADKKEAADALGRSASQLSRECNKDPELRERFEDAWYYGAGPIIEELARQAIEGWQQEVYQGGKFVGYKTIKEPTAGFFAVKARRPEYKEKNDVEMTHHIQINVEDRSANAREVWEVLKQAGVEPVEIIEQIDEGTALKELPPASEVLAQPPVVQPEASSVPSSSE